MPQKPPFVSHFVETKTVNESIAFGLSRNLFYNLCVINE